LSRFDAHCRSTFPQHAHTVGITAQISPLFKCGEFSERAPQLARQFAEGGTKREAAESRRLSEDLKIEQWAYRLGVDLLTQLGEALRWCLNEGSCLD
jgi:hypothetical protein